MLVQRRNNILSSEITDERTYLNRRQFIQGTSGAALGLATGAFALSSATNLRAGSQETIPDIQTSAFSTNEQPNSFSDITSYNNFYEFGLDKGDPARHAHELTVKPWSVKVEGHVNKAAEYDLEDLLKGITFEERIYRLRCVEAWSMVVPWVGFPLSTLINRFEPTSNAKFIELTTVYRPEEMPGQRRAILSWPYIE